MTELNKFRYGVGGIRRIEVGGGENLNEYESGVRVNPRKTDRQEDRNKMR